MAHFDELETRMAQSRATAQLEALNGQLIRTGMAPIGQIEDLEMLPLMRPGQVAALQAEAPPFGGLPVHNVGHVVQGPDGVFAPAGLGDDWWRMGRFVHAAGIGAGDVMMLGHGDAMAAPFHMFQSGARAVGATVVCAGHLEVQAQAALAQQIGATCYAGTGAGLTALRGAGVPIPRAVMMVADAGPVDPEVTVRTCLATADLGLIAYDATGDGTMILDESVLVEILEGEGMVVTTLNRDYPLLRYVIGQGAEWVEGASTCGRTHQRIRLT